MPSKRVAAFFGFSPSIFLSIFELECPTDKSISQNELKMFFEGCYRFFDIPDDRLKPIVGGAPSNWGLECVLEALIAYVIACVGVSCSLHAYFLLKRKIHGFAWPPDNWAQFGENRFERFIGKIYNFGGLLLIAVVVAPLMVLMVGLTYLSLGAWAFDALMRLIAFVS